MNSIFYLTFICGISILSLLSLFLVYILDIFSTSSEQKIKFMKNCLLIVFIVPFFYIFLDYFSFSSIEIKTQNELFNFHSVRNIASNLTANTYNWPNYALIVYAIGVLIVLIRIFSSYLIARKKFADAAPTYIQGQLVFCSSSITTPFNFGLLKSKIYFPIDIEKQWTTRQIHLSLIHEKFHQDQNDTLWKVFSLITQAFLFFAPWTYFFHKKFELEMEIFCDEKTCANANATLKEYGNLLLAMGCFHKKNPAFIHLANSNLKRRFISMKTKKSKRPLLVSILSISMLLTGTASVAGSNWISQQENAFDVTSRIFIDGELVSSPRIITRANQPASIYITDKSGEKSLNIKLIAKDEKDNIAMNFDVYYKNGKEKLHVKPIMILASQQEGNIQISYELGHSFEMRVIAKRQ